MNPGDESMGVFAPSSSGYIRHWLVAGPDVKPYTGPSRPEHILRQEALDASVSQPPVSATLGQTGPFGKTWHFHDPGRNEFVELSDFYQVPAAVDIYAFTQISCPSAGERKATFWVAGIADLWVNHAHVTRLSVTRYRNPDAQSISLSLHQGLNTLCVRLQCFGVRDTRILFGLLLEAPEGLSVHLPHAGDIARAERWINTIRAFGHDRLESEPAPFEARVIGDKGEVNIWAAGSSAFTIPDHCRSLKFDVETTAGGNTPDSQPATLKRQFEVSSPKTSPPAFEEMPHRLARLAYTAKAGIDGQAPAPWNAKALPLLARRLLGRTTGQDATDLTGTLAFIEQRNDCADFALAGLLRMEFLHLWTAEESAQLRRTALAFRYWQDEPGNDGMCFHSENHSLLFHGCQLLAGRLYPDDVFSNSGHTGREQAAIALALIRKWLETIEARGFEEFNSSSYIPITVAAMLNVVDFSGDKELSMRMSVQIDRIFHDLACHAFDGGVISPQGRVYRDVLRPEQAGTQMLLAAALNEPVAELSGPRSSDGASGDWTVFLLSSPGYHPPSDLAPRLAQSVSKTYRNADFQIVLEKTPAYILTSLAVPAVPREGEHPEIDLRPGGAGYQQHLWQATLGRDCHIFVNHPGGFFDGTKSRPGYWHGSGLLPRVRQEGNWLQAIHVIPDGTKTKPEITPSGWLWPAPSSHRPFHLHPIPFVHVHWPADAFDVKKSEGLWRFGQKGRGLIGLWCSEPLQPHDDILTGREFRANGYTSAWLVICGDSDKDGPLESFMTACQSRNPTLDRDTLVLAMSGESPTKWWERSEPMPS